MSARAAFGVAALVAGVASAAYLAWRASREDAPATPPFPGVEQVGLWPDLRQGDVVLIDGPRSQLGIVGTDIVATVDMVLSDRSVISVAVIDPRFAGRRVGGTIPRDAILRTLGLPSTPNASNV